jgi:hypothetical protein
MQDQSKDIRCGMFLGLSINRSNVSEDIDSIVKNYLEYTDGDFENYQDIEFVNHNQEDMFYEELKYDMLSALDKFNFTRERYYETLENLVIEYIQKNWINILYD